ncbi:SRPBCC family protein [Bdellovibrio svalbardensis]|uniref:SRPBCC domain-containing protein n=1 Tax=Bdellovibrio svalbardensis TaxID=2972972 RepID=A0ABT6DI74_9BACT|nr:SRPBCC family protein [Bdellovibrio svalbardensis]MDG0816493.1 SRPBCC domain-containing protein [Bdellovibrio svalbardensis]
MQTSTEKSTHSTVHKNSTSQSPLIEMEHSFNVPVDQLFKAFKTSDALKAWWWPKGLYADRVDIDFRKGGKYFINMKGSNQGGGDGMTGLFEEIIENERIVLTDQFADKNGRAISAQEAQMPGDWPELGYITFEFDSVDEKKSRILFTQEGIPAEMKKDCIQGWTEMFDKLEAYLGSRNVTNT